MTDKEAWITFASAALSGLCAASGGRGYDDGLASDAVNAADVMLEKLHERFPSEVPDQYQEPAEHEPPATDPYEGIPIDVLERVWWNVRCGNWHDVLVTKVPGEGKTENKGYAVFSGFTGFAGMCPRGDVYTGGCKDTARASVIRIAMKDGIFGEEYRD